MINKVKLIILLTLLMILLIFGIYMCLAILYNKNMITDISIEKYEPFSDNNILKKMKLI